MNGYISIFFKKNEKNIRVLNWVDQKVLFAKLHMKLKLLHENFLKILIYFALYQKGKKYYYMDSHSNNFNTNDNISMNYLNF